MSTSIKIWLAVPAGSRLEFGVASESDKFTAGARIRDDDGAAPVESECGHAAMVPGPKSVPLAAAHTYAVRVRVAFAGQTEVSAVLRACIRTPTGAIHGSPYEYTMSGRQGDIRRADITAVVT